MSQENLELVRRALEAVWKRPEADFDTINALYDPAHVWIPAWSRLGHSEVEGARGFKAWLAESSDFVSWTGKLHGVVDLDAGRVLAVGTLAFHGASSEIDVEQRTWILHTVVDGRITRTEAFLDAAAALDSARSGE